MKYEGMLPPRKKLDGVIERDMPTFVRDLAWLKQEMGDIIVPDIEFDLDNTADHFEEMAQYLLDNGFLDSTDSGAEHDAVYRAALFAYQISVTVHQDETAFNAYEYLQALRASSNSPQQRFKDEVRDYLDANPSIMALIGAHAQDIYPDPIQLNTIMYTAGLTFMLVERREGEKYTLAEFADVTPEDIIDNTSE